MQLGPRRRAAVVTLLLVLAIVQLNQSDEPIQNIAIQEAAPPPRPPNRRAPQPQPPLRLPVAVNQELSASEHTKPGKRVPGVQPWRAGSNEVYMWDELCDNAELCKERCALRAPCASYDYKPNTACQLYRAHDHAYPNTTRDNRLSVPADCALNSECSCPLSTRVKDPLTREMTCELLAGKTVLFSGDSLIRDQWTTLGVWLAGLETDLFDGRTVENHAACMINAWKFLNYIGTEKRMKARGLYSSHPGQPRKFTVCSGATTLLFDTTNLFSDIQNQFSQNSRLSGVDMWILGGGVHQMVSFGDDETQVRGFIKWLEQRVSGTATSTPIKAVYVGTHHRIVELAPRAYQGYAQGPQGNEKIERWNRLFCQGLKNVLCVDPYWITRSLDQSHPDTEDGMHMGFWVNLQKVQVLLRALSTTKEDVSFPEVRIWKM